MKILVIAWMKAKEDEVDVDQWEGLKADDVEAWRVNDKRVVVRRPEMGRQ